MAKKVLMLHGINHNMFGKRDPAQYGTITLAEIDARLAALGEELGAEVESFQTNSEAAMRAPDSATGPGAVPSLATFPPQPFPTQLVARGMATALAQLHLVPPGGLAEVGARELDYVLAIRYAAERFPRRFVWLTPWELAFLKRQVEVGGNYPLAYVVAILRQCPQLPLIQ